MKTNPDFPDDLPSKAQAMVEGTSRGEMAPDPSLENWVTTDQYDFPLLRKTGITPVTNELIRKIDEEQDCP